MPISTNSEHSHFKLFVQKNPSVILSYGPGRRTLAQAAAEDEKITHTALDGMCGGKFSVPSRLLEDFYDAYGRDMYQGTPLYLAERHTEPVFVMHLDIDFKALEQPDRVQAFCELIQNTVSDYYCLPVKSIVCAVVDDGGNRKPGAPGLHFIFPKTHVTRDQALLLRAGIVARCHAQLPWGGDWDTIIDISVLSNKGGALRMIGSDKCRKCIDCERGNSCTQANCRFKHVSENKVYWPWKVYPDDASSHEYWQHLSNKAYAVKQCTVRSPPDAQSRPDFTPPALAPSASLMVPAKSGRARSRNAEGGFVFDLRSSEDKPERGFEAAQLDEASHAELLYAIQRYHGMYANLSIKRGGISRCLQRDGEMSYIIKVQGFGDRYCCNKQDVHKSSTIYFFYLAKQNRICQKCFCKKDTIRAGGSSCVEFRGERKFLPDRLSAILLNPENAAAARPSWQTESPAERAQPVQLQLNFRMALF